MSWHCEIRKDREAIISPKVRPGRALWSVRAAHVRFGSGTDVAASLINVRFTSESGHRASYSIAASAQACAIRAPSSEFTPDMPVPPAILPSITVRDAMLKSRVVDYPPLGTKESLAPGFSTTYARRHG